MSNLSPPPKKVTMDRTAANADHKIQTNDLTGITNPSRTNSTHTLLSCHLSNHNQNNAVGLANQNKSPFQMAETSTKGSPTVSTPCVAEPTKSLGVLGKDGQSTNYDKGVLNPLGPNNGPLWIK